MGMANDIRGFSESVDRTGAGTDRVPDGAVRRDDLTTLPRKWRTCPMCDGAGGDMVLDLDQSDAIDRALAKG